MFKLYDFVVATHDGRTFDAFVANLSYSPTTGKTLYSLIEDPIHIDLFQRSSVKVVRQWSRFEHIDLIKELGILQNIEAEDLLSALPASDVIDELKSKGISVWEEVAFDGDVYCVTSYAKAVYNATRAASKGRSPEPFFIADISDEQYKRNTELAEYWRSKGLPFGNSKGICGTFTRGYGRLDNYGYFEYSLSSK